ncbi:MAG: hypothetical protein AB8E15_07435 [Bdellovibrionales bacterium]
MFLRMALIVVFGTITYTTSSFAHEGNEDLRTYDQYMESISKQSQHPDDSFRSWPEKRSNYLESGFPDVVNLKLKMESAARNFEIELGELREIMSKPINNRFELIYKVEAVEKNEAKWRANANLLKHLGLVERDIELITPQAMTYIESCRLRFQQLDIDFKSNLSE